MKSHSIIAATLLLLCSCTSVREGVDLSLTNVKLSDVTVLETTALFTVRVQNENATPLNLKGSVYRIYLNGNYIGKGMTDKSLEVPAFGTATQTVPVYLQNLFMASKVRAIVENQRFDYEIDGTLHDAKGTISATSDGKLDLKDFQPTPKKSQDLIVR